MRYGVILSCLAIAGCELPPENAPIAFKVSQASGELIDGIELSVLCELSKRMGTEYRASDVDMASLLEVEQSFGSQRLLNVGDVVCGGQDGTLELPFTLDEQRGLVSTWSELGGETEDEDTAWVSCVADLSRPEGDRVILCEVNAATASPNLPFNLNPDQTDEVG